MSASGPVLAAVTAALNVAGYTGAVTGATVTVTNSPSQALATPYTVVLIRHEDRSLDTMGKPGKSVTVELHHHSDYQGDKELLTLRNKALELLHYSALSVTSHTLVSVQYEDGVDVTPDDVVGIQRRHWVDTYRVDVKQTTP